MKDIPCDSREGMTKLIDFARAHRFVLSEAHEKLAKKHGVATDGVFFARPLP